MNDVLFKLTINIPIEEFMINWGYLINIFFIIILIYSIELMVCLFFIFKKENIKPWIAFIPFYNIYHYFKITKTPFWTIFVPFINLVVLAVVPYRLAKQYQCPKWILNLSIPFSIVIIPYVAFSKRINKRIRDEYNPLKSIYDIDKIESDINAEEIDNLIFEEYYVPEDTKDIDYMSNIDTMINDIEDTAQKEDYFFEDQVSDVIIATTELATDLEKIEEIDNDGDLSISEEDMLEIFDKVDETLSTNDIDQLEEIIENKNNITIIDNAEYKEVEEVQQSAESIAFGGEDNRTKLAASKTSDLVCSRCGSSLVGASGSCPGCGAQI